LVSTLLLRVRTQQGSKSIIGLGTTALHLEVESQVSIPKKDPHLGATRRCGRRDGGGWKYLGALGGIFAPKTCLWVEVIVQQEEDKIAYSSINSSTHPFIYPFTHSFIH
jgi:hypothetical protein